jgi:hypothetical protein
MVDLPLLVVNDRRAQNRAAAVECPIASRYPLCPLAGATASSRQLKHFFAEWTSGHDDLGRAAVLFAEHPRTISQHPSLFKTAGVAVEETHGGTEYRFAGEDTLFASDSLVLRRLSVRHNALSDRRFQLVN